MKKNNVVSVVRYFILIAVKVKQRGECSQSRKTAYSERSQKFHFNSGESTKA